MLLAVTQSSRECARLLLSCSEHTLQVCMFSLHNKMSAEQDAAQHAGLTLLRTDGRNFTYSAPGDPVVLYAYDGRDASARAMWSSNKSYLGCSP